MSNILKGIAAAPGITISPAFPFVKEREEISPEDITDVDEAIESLDAALEKSKKELRKIFALATDKIGEKRAAIFEAQIMILDDPVLIANIKSRIKKEKKLPEFIVDDEISKYQKIMNNSNEMYMKERSHDIEDIKNRIIRNLKKKKWKSRITSDVIVVSANISPSDTVLFARVNVKGYVTDFGGLTSHAAIVARSLNIPAVVGLHEATRRISEGDTLIVDGFHGEVVINPTDEQIKYYKKKIGELLRHSKQLLKLKDLPCVTLDGKEVKLMANLDISEEMDLIISSGSKGIGLVRTEQLFEEYESFPDEEEQLAVYSQILSKINDEEVIIRTWDIGGDKVLPVDLKEPNPFLGWRGIRLLLDNRNLFKTQLRAILRASKDKNVKVMLPMIASIAEVRKSKAIVEECKKELRSEGREFNEKIKIGIMIEIPSAAVLTREFADETDFISIGTNDLIQYLLAVDRGNDNVSAQYQEFHPAVIRTLQHIIGEGKKAGAEVSMCGEMAADLIAVPLLVGMGLEVLSLSPSNIPLVKKIIRNLNYSELRQLADECLTMKTEKEINARLHNFFQKKLSAVLNNLF